MSSQLQYNSGRLTRQYLPIKAADPFQLSVQLAAVEAQQRAQRLVLCRRADMPRDGQVRQEGADLRFPHLQGMPLVVEEDEPPDPAEIRFLCAQTIAPHSKRLAHLVQELGRSRRRCSIERRIPEYPFLQEYHDR
jgi:hypothetical protein